MCDYMIYDGDRNNENGIPIPQFHKCDENSYCSGYGSCMDTLTFYNFCYEHSCPCFYSDPDHPTITPNNCGNKGKHIILNNYDDRECPYMSVLCDNCLHIEIKDPGYN